jgi:glycosyltransferase involved in cell wall biosynthesis
MPPKRILIFSLAYYPDAIGGAEVAIKEITDRCPEIEFHMVTLRFDSNLPKVQKIGNVLVHRIGFAAPHPKMSDLKKFPLHLNKYWFQLAAAWKAASLHRRYRYDATWAMMAHACGIPAALFKFFYPRTPYILTLQEGDPPEHIEHIMRPVWPLFSRAFTSADIIQTISNFLARWARARGFKGPLEVVPNAVDVAHFSQIYPEQVINGIRDALGKKMGEIFLITTSRLVRKNAVDDVIRALPLLPQNVRFIILGIGPDEDALKKLTVHLDVEKRVAFVGHVGHADLPKYLKASDIFIRPSRSEGMGNSFVEAMAAGLPVIATQEGGIADFLFDEKRDPDKPVTGFAVDTDSPQDIARAVKEIIGHPEKVRAVVATARAMVVEKYDWNLIARDMRERVFTPALKGDK